MNLNILKISPVHHLLPGQGPTLEKAWKCCWDFSSPKTVVLESVIKPSICCYLCSPGLVSLWQKNQEQLNQDTKLLRVCTLNPVLESLMELCLYIWIP